MAFSPNLLSPGTWEPMSSFEVDSLELLTSHSEMVEPPTEGESLEEIKQAFQDMESKTSNQKRSAVPLPESNELNDASEYRPEVSTNPKKKVTKIMKCRAYRERVAQRQNQLMGWVRQLLTLVDNLQEKDFAATDRNRRLWERIWDLELGRFQEMATIDDTLAFLDSFSQPPMSPEDDQVVEEIAQLLPNMNNAPHERSTKGNKTPPLHKEDLNGSTVIDDTYRRRVIKAQKCKKYRERIWEREIKLKRWTGQLLVFVNKLKYSILKINDQNRRLWAGIADLEVEAEGRRMSESEVLISDVILSDVEWQHFSDEEESLFSRMGE